MIDYVSQKKNKNTTKNVSLKEKEIRKEKKEPLKDNLKERNFQSLKKVTSYNGDRKKL